MVAKRKTQQISQWGGAPSSQEFLRFRHPRYRDNRKFVFETAYTVPGSTTPLLASPVFWMGSL
eukprot:5810051-Prymnesium_polylepis.1